MYTALITDIDGTVAAIGTDGSDISNQTREAVKDAQKKGKKITCATGRGWSSARPVVEHLGISDPCIIEGGSCIIDPKTQEILWETSLSKSDSIQVLQIFKQLAIENAHVKSTSKDVRLPLAQVGTMTSSNRIIYLLGVDVATADRVINTISDTSFAVAHKTPSWNSLDLIDVHVTNPLGTKEHAITKWQEMMGVTKQETIGLGDSENDLPLFKSVGLRVFVDNAHNDLKIIADEVVPACDKGGLEYAINKLLLG